MPLLQLKGVIILGKQSTQAILYPWLESIKIFLRFFADNPTIYNLQYTDTFFKHADSWTQWLTVYLRLEIKV